MKPHIAFLPSPGMGHSIPLLQLAKQLVFNFGFKVSFFAITTEASAAQNHLMSSSARLSTDLRIINIPPTDVSDVIKDDMRLVTRLSVIVRKSIKPFTTLLTDLKPVPSALIIDIFCTDAIDICRKLSIPVYSFFTASTSLLTFSLYLPTMDHAVDGEFTQLPGPIDIPGCKPMPTDDILDQVKSRKNEEYDWYLLHVSRLPTVAGILLNAWEKLDIQRITALRNNIFFKEILTPPIFPVGPLIKEEEALAEKDKEIIAWLDKQPQQSVVFVCLGSGGTLTSQQLTEMAWGLEMSDQRFIFVTQKPSDTSTYAMYFTSGDNEKDPLEYLPEGFLRRTNGRGIVLRSWGPQVEILRHPSTGAFLTHCGWNSTLESLVNGVPIIAWPLYAEQRMNATMLVEEVKVGMKVTVTNVVERKEVERVIRQMMEEENGKAMRLRASELKENAREALANGGSSWRSLSQLVEIWR